MKTALHGGPDPGLWIAPASLARRSCSAGHCLFDREHGALHVDRTQHGCVCLRIDDDLDDDDDDDDDDDNDDLGQDNNSHNNSHNYNSHTHDDDDNSHTHHDDNNSHTHHDDNNNNNSHNASTAPTCSTASTSTRLPRNVVMLPAQPLHSAPARET
ncbi:hypothetical protein ST47_g5065 [Ascochyta rabiei]|uniref:Uncharacterized protein n=1 Tax=Didymella rabiei TaxID=5454 RepID=A0A163EMW8_DIDRA|nr:hypothetical protein ST47_g5065 [Ascochyta rabiei]